MFEVQVTETLFSYFAAHWLAPLWTVSETFEKGPSEIKTALDDCLRNIDDQTVEAYRLAPEFRSSILSMSQDVPDDEIRIELLQKTLDRMIAERRLNLLRESSEIERPAPYMHPALNHIPIGENSLVNLDAFQLHEGGYAIDGYVFNLAHILPGYNSSYWINQALQSIKENATIQIRLDPFRILPITDHREISFKMLVWGVPLDWQEIRNLQDIQHGRWMPSTLNSTEAEYTDVCWEHRGEEIHFVCEEIPNTVRLTQRGSRYFHAIYDPETNCFIHIDGALRIYNTDELDLRRETHVRKAGKLGRRIKIFQVDGLIETEVWSILALGFFVWNMDMEGYFHGKRTFDA